MCTVKLSPKHQALERSDAMGVVIGVYGAASTIQALADACRFRASVAEEQATSAHGQAREDALMNAARFLRAARLLETIALGDNHP